MRKKHTGARPNDFLQALVVVVTKGQGFKAVRPSHTYHLAKSLEVLAEWITESQGSKTLLQSHTLEALVNKLAAAGQGLKTHLAKSHLGGSGWNWLLSSQFEEFLGKSHSQGPDARTKSMF